MTHRQKVDHLIEELRSRGLGASTVAPPLFRLLWALGLETPPPLFWRFIPLTLLMGVFFGFFWGLFMALAFLIWLVLGEGLWLGHGGGPLLSRGIFGLTVVAGGAAVAGLLFGLVMAAYSRWKAAQLRLPSWENYPVEE
jgi:membrane associated rhomboid family serine protease